MTLNSFNSVYSDSRIKKIIIVDDASEMEYFKELKSVCDLLPKVRLIRNVTNQNCYRNKMHSALNANTEWVIIFDSDNELNAEYIDAIFNQEWDKNTMYCPTFAKPIFNYRLFSGLTITKENVREYMDKPMFETALNTFNLFINKEEYLRVWDGTVDPMTSDSIYFAYCWLKAGNKIKFVEGMEYQHAVHDGSHYKNNCHLTHSDFKENLINKIKELR